MRAQSAVTGLWTEWEDTTIIEVAAASEIQMVLADADGTPLARALKVADIEQIRFRGIVYDTTAAAYDANASDLENDGVGIQEVEYRITTQSIQLYRSVADQSPYCMFDDTSGDCNMMDSMKYDAIVQQSGIYTIQMRAQSAVTGLWTEWEDTIFALGEPPQLRINFPDGRPGSAFVVSGTHYLPDTDITVLINDADVGTATTDADGAFTLVLSTSPDALPGVYAIVVRIVLPTLNAAAADATEQETVYTLATDAPLREHTVAPGEPEIEIDGDILPANGSRVYLPAVQR
jgi:hypothetical protein